MKMAKTLIILFVAGLAFTSCKNKNPESTSTENNTIKSEEVTPQNVENDNAELVAKIKEYITTKYLTAADLRTISEDQRKFQISQIDLDNDGKKEVFVNFSTSYFCGSGGCSIVLLDDNIEPITKFTVTRTPLYIEKTTENGWRTIMTESEGKWRKLIYKDGAYPSNPSLAEISSDSPTKDAAILFADKNELETFSF